MWTTEPYRVCVSFCNCGKDSGLYLHLTATLARKMNKRSMFSSLTGSAILSPVPSPILNHYVNITRTLLSVFIGVALPPTTKFPFHNTSRNCGSVGSRVPTGYDNRQRCELPSAFFSFYQQGMTFEQFVRDFADWFSRKTILPLMLVGIRSDRSYNRFAAIANSHKLRFADGKYGRWLKGHTVYLSHL